MMLPRFVLAVAALGLAASGCSQATGEVQGGTPLAVESASSEVCGPDAGSTWTDLYSCYFGPSGVASCAALGECHASATDPGGMEGFVCGPTKATCYTGFTTFPSDSDAGAVNSATGLLPWLRATDNPSALMPCNVIQVVFEGTTSVECNSSAGNAYTFTQDDIARIQAWITEGAQDN